MSYNDWKNKQAFASAQQRWDDMLPEDEEGYYDDEDEWASYSDGMSYSIASPAYPRYVEEDYCLNPYHYEDED